jgi:inner membrane protein
MTTPTHAVFHLLVSNIFGIPLNGKNIVFGLIGTLLPDLSNPYGGLGRLLKPVSGFIVQKWGHRSITHSWVFIALVFALLLPVKVLSDEVAVWLVLLGIANHIFLDMMNISGVRFFYPDSLIVVMPAMHEVRIATGSKKEKRLAFGLFLLAVLTLPLGIWGYESTLRFIAGSHTAAVEEYKKFIDKYEIYVEVISGVNRITQESIRHKKYKLIAAMPKKLSLAEDDDGRRVTLGQVEDAIVETKRMRVYKGVPIKVQVQEFTLNGCCFELCWFKGC